MRRDLDSFSQAFDVAVIGAGVYGVSIARLAALSGLKVALVDRGDFGGETSRNSAKLLHGGFRYVQNLDLSRVRESVRARRAWFRFAPHLVQPLRVLVATHGHGLRSRPALAAGLLAFHAVAADRNRGVAQGLGLPRPGILTARQLALDWPFVLPSAATGGAYWYDGLMLDASRLVLECIYDAVDAGAVAANHFECLSLLHAGKRVYGFAARDCLQGKEYEIRARMTINATGQASSKIAATGPTGLSGMSAIGWTRNLNIVTRRLHPGSDAIGIENSTGFRQRTGAKARTLFISPWHGCSIVGTSHVTLRAEHDDIDASDAAIMEMIDEVSDALPSLELGASDVRSVHVGYTLADETGASGAKRSLMLDHRSRDGVEGFVSVIGNKYTTAPEIARRAVAAVIAGLDIAGLNGPTRLSASGVPMTVGSGASRTIPDASSGLDEEHDWAERVYGSRALQCLGMTQCRHQSDQSVFRARVLFGIQNEMVCRLPDAVFRATDWAERGILESSQLHWCASVLAERYSWSAARTAAELVNTRAALLRHRIVLRESLPDRATCAAGTDHPANTRERR